MKLSIIIPVGEISALNRCDQSLRTSIENGPKDVEVEVLPCYDLEHRGVFSARNEGLKRATGEWIAWVDCDDIVEENWFAEIVAAIKKHPDVDIIQFDATEIRHGHMRSHAYGRAGLVSGNEFARSLLRATGMPAWLWTRVFKRKLFAGRKFVGRVNEDYRMFLEVLPEIGQVWSVGKPLYRYIRRGTGISNYTQAMDYREAGAAFEALIRGLPEDWQRDAHIGMALIMADVTLHSKIENGARYWVRKYLWLTLKDARVSLRLKFKALLATFG